MRLKTLFDHPIIPLAVIMDVAFLSLVAALIGQFMFDLAPCQMCIYQRIPFVIVIILMIAAIILPRFRPAAVALSGLAYLANSGLAFYHTGIEQRWWEETAGCSVNFDFSEPSLMDQITSAQAASCAEIPWVDPILGLSMANYNILLCAGMFVFCMMAFKQQVQSKP